MGAGCKRLLSKLPTSANFDCQPTWSVPSIMWQKHLQRKGAALAAPPATPLHSSAAPKPTLPACLLPPAPAAAAAFVDTAGCGYVSSQPMSFLPATAHECVGVCVGVGENVQS